MALLLIIFALIVFTCIFLNNISSKIGIPVLLLFIVFGLLAGLRFESLMETYGSTIDDVCTIALIFVMFYGGFGTRWTSAKPVIAEAGLLASAGVILTASFVGLFCHFVLHWGVAESFLMGSVICSTDAATVFSILRTRNLGLKKNLAPLLEIESGSNDPCSYMLTAIFISVMKGTATGGMVVWTVFSQLFFGALSGALIAIGSAYFLKRYHFTHTGFDSLFIFAVAVIAYALPAAVGGNGFLSVYIVGVFLGNQNFPGRKALVPFFDAVTDLMQIVIFFLLGFMAVGHNLVKAIPTAVILFAFIALVARPVSVFAILAPFRKYTARMMGFISFVGLRGAASIVFAIMTVIELDSLQHDIFSIVFVIVLISIAGQGSLIPKAAGVFAATDPDANDLKTFSDFAESDELSFGKVSISEGSPWNGKAVSELQLPREILVVRVIRGGESLVPGRHLVLEAGDVAVVATRHYSDPVNAMVQSIPVPKGSQWAGRDIRDFAKAYGALVIMLRRNDDVIIPDAQTEIMAGDTLVTVLKPLIRKSE